MGGENIEKLKVFILILFVLSFVSLQAVSADDIYVNPQAAGEGSGTIDNPYSNIQLALDNVRDNSVINLMPGTYNGINNSDLTVKVNNLTITSYRGPAIFTPAVDSSPTRYFNITGSSVVLNGLTFISGVSMAYEDTVGGEVIINAQNVIVNNTKFINSVSRGGTLYVTADSTIIQNTLFDNNTVNVGDGAGAHVEAKKLSVINSTFRANHVNNGAGGGLYFVGDNLLVDTSNFTSNYVSARKGGAIYTEAANVKIINSRFFNQTTSNANGGAIYASGDNFVVENSSFEKNTANGAMGGAINFEGTNLTVNKSNFTDNVAQGQSGASIYSKTSNLATLTDSYFDSNKAWNGAGGAIYNTGSMLIVDNSTFANHITTLRNGAGVIYMDGSLNITNSNFTNNYGYTGVGAVHQLNGDLYINNTLFDSNQGWNLNGGAVCIENSNFLVENNNFTSNNAGSSGGAIYADKSNGTVQDNVFDKNMANNGAGSLHLIGDNYTIQRNNFSNGPKYSVGFIILKGDNNTVDKCNFEHGYSQNSIGGAIASYGENLKVTNCNMNDIDTPSVGGMIYSKGNNTFIENCNLNDSETIYGVIFIEGDNPVINNISMSNVRSNIGAVHLRSNNATVTNSTFDKCQKSSYGNGGVIFWTGEDYGKRLSLDTLTVDNCTFIECNGEGGYNTAVTAFGNNVLVNNSDFIDCYSPYCGAITFRGSNASIVNSNFDGCEAAVYAGAISMAGDNVTVDSCNFTNNWAMMYGGAIYSTASNSNITNNLFVNNTVGSDGTKYIKGRTSPVSYYPGDGGGVMVMAGNNMRITNNKMCNASMTGSGGAIENRANSLFSNNNISNINVSISGGGIMNYGRMDDRSTITNCHAGEHGNEIYNLGLEGPVYMILDEKPRYLYVGESTIVPIGLVNENGATVTVPHLQGLIHDDAERVSFIQFDYNEAEDESGINVTFTQAGVYIFKPLAQQSNIYLAEDNMLTIYVVDRMPVEIELPEITAYPQDIVDYTFNITNPNGLLIRNGTVWMVINNHNYTAEILNGKVNITDHDLSGKVVDVKYSADYNGNITFRDVHLYDDAGIHNVTAYYESNCNYYADASQNGTIEILSIATYIPEVKIDAFVRDEVTFSIDVKSETGRKVGGNASFYLPYVLANNLLPSQDILNATKFGEYDGILFTVKLRKNLTLKIPVESEFRLPIFYNGDNVFSASQGLLNISTHRNPTQVISPIIYAEVGVPFDILINVTSKYTVDENVVRVIFADQYSEIDGDVIAIPSHYYDVAITEGYVERITTLYMPGVYANPVIYTGGQSFIGSSSVCIIVVALVNVTVDAEDIYTFPGDVKNITVNLTDKYGNNVLNGTVNTTINGKTYFANVTNGTATFADVALDETEAEYNFTVNYNGNDYYSDANATALIRLVKINTSITAADIEGLPGDKKSLNITLNDEYGNAINATVKVKYPDGRGEVIDLSKNNSIVLPNPGYFEIEVNYTGSVKYNPSNATIRVYVNPLNTTVDGKNISGYPNQLVNITVNVTDEKGNQVINGTAVFMLVYGHPIYAEVINGTATFVNVELPENEGNYSAIVNYYDLNEYYNPSQTIINITVAKIDTNINANNVKGRTGEKINIAANVTDANGNHILNGTANLTINGNEYTANITNGTITFVDIILPNPGNYTANITYPGSDVYNQSNTTVDVTVLKLDTNINADNVTGLPGDIVNITADVTDENGKEVVNGTAILTVGDTEYVGEVINGSVTFECVVLQNPGNYTAPIKYDGTEIYNPSNTSIVINVLKIDSNITANSISGKTGDKANITANVTDIGGNPILNGTAILNIGGKDYTANITNGTVTFEDVVLPTPGNYTANITYPGDDYYNPSNAAIDISVSKLDTNITAGDVAGYPGEKVNITADITDVNGNPVLNGAAVIVVGGVEYVGDVNNGTVTFVDVILPGEGNYTASVNYNGTEIYNPSNTAVDISVSKIDSNMTSTSVNTYPGEKFNVTANVTDVNGNPITKGTATLTVNGTNYTAPIVNGTVTFENVTLNEGNYTGVITYSGSDVYNPSNTTVDISVSKLDTTIVSEDVYGYPGERVNIIADVTDENGNHVLNGTAILIIGDKIGEAPDGFAAAGEYVAKVENGKAVFEGVILPSPGVYPADLMYLGDELYNPSNSTININVLKRDSKVTSDNITSKPDALINITANVTDSEGNPIQNGTATLTINGTNYTAPIVNGTVTFENIDLPAGNHTGVITYLGDDMYNPSRAAVNVDISKVNTNISADPVNGNPSDKINVTVNVIDDGGNPVLNGTVTLIIDGVEYSAEVQNGTATFIDVILPKSSTTAILRYDGNEYYAPSESTFDIKINASESVNNQTASSENEIKKSVNYSVDSKQTGNPIVIALLVLMCLVSNNILRRKR